VSGDAADLDDDLGAAAMADAEVPVRRLADDDDRRSSGRGRQEVLDAPAGALLVDRVHDEQVARQPVLDERCGRVRLERERTLDVHRAAAVKEAIRNHGVVRSVLPGRRIARVDHVHVAAHHDRGTSAAAADQPDRVADLVRPGVVVAELVHLGDDAHGDRPFRSRWARYADQVLREAQHAIEVRLQASLVVQM
jgi:hypothetical protein